MSGSVKPKSPGANVYATSSPVVTVLLAPAGGSFAATAVTMAVAALLAFVPSVATKVITRTAVFGLSDASW